MTTSRAVIAVTLVATALSGALPAFAADPPAIRAHAHRPAGRSAHRHAHRPVHRHRRARPAAVPGLTTTADPSGVPMPVGNLPGWKQVFSDDFTETTLNPAVWKVYWGQPGGDPGGWFDPSHVYTSGGMLVISAYQDPADGGAWATGGVSTSPSFDQTYGKYEVRFRMDAGVGIAHTILLWPQSNAWPPEVDFSEDNGGDRQTDYATLHYGASNTMIQNQLAVNLTQWHTLGVEWTPGRLVYTVDGRDWATVSNPNVPSIPMSLDIQTQAWACGTSSWEHCPNATTPAHVNLDVDWAVAYARS